LFCNPFLSFPGTEKYPDNAVHLSWNLVFILCLFAWCNKLTSFPHAVYVFAKTYKRDQDKKNAQAATAVAAVAKLASPASETAKVADPIPSPAPKRVLPPVSEEEQRQLYTWMLEEKRKIKPRDAAEKKKINEEKALLKEFISESLPRLWGFHQLSSCSTRMFSWLLSSEDMLWN
jgi:hypothetical protein